MPASVTNGSGSATATSDNSNGGTIAWGSLGNITGEDGSRTLAMGVPASPGLTDRLVITGFGFSIPTNATIVGIVGEIKCSKGGTQVLADAEVKLVKGGVVQSTNKASGTDWNQTTDIFRTYGGAADLWSTTWTPANANASGFGIAISVTKVSGGAANARVDFARITIYFQTRGSGLCSITLGASATGRRRIFGDAISNAVATVAGVGRRIVRGVASAVFGFTASGDGHSEAPSPNTDPNLGADVVEHTSSAEVDQASTAVVLDRSATGVALPDPGLRAIVNGGKTGAVVTASRRGAIVDPSSTGAEVS